MKRDGTITGLRVRTVADAGAYPGIGAFLPFFTQMMSQERVPHPQDRVQLAGRRHQHHADRRVPRRGPSRSDPPRRAHARHRRRRTRHRSGGDPPQELHPGRRVPVHDDHRGDLRHRRVREAARRGARRTRATTSCAPSRPQRRERDDRCCSASACPPTSRSPRRSACTASGARSRSKTTARCSATSARARTDKVTRPRSR